MVALVRGTDRVDLGKLATVSGRPRLRRASAKEAKARHRLRHRRRAAVRTRPATTVVMDPALDGYEEVWAAAGTPTTVFAIAPATLAMLADALVAPCAEDPCPAERIGDRGRTRDRRLSRRAGGALSLGRQRFG